MTATMGNIAALRQQWRDRCQQDDSSHTAATELDLYVTWLLGRNPDQWADKPPVEWQLWTKGIDYRYRVLQRYLSLKPSTRYAQLLKKLCNLLTLRHQITTWVALSRDRHRTVLDVIEEVLQEMLHRDRHLHQELEWIRTCTPRRDLQEAFLCTSLEEYCLRPIQNHPLISYRFVNFMRRYQRGGITQLPSDQHLRLLSTELETQTPDQTLNLLDNEAIARHQSHEDYIQQQSLRQAVLDQFIQYLQENVKDPYVIPWLQLYLQGNTQEAIATELNLPISKIYRLRDKVKYHAIHNFAIKTNPDLVAQWLETAHQNQFGLTPQQWQQFQAQLTPSQLQTLMKHPTPTPQQTATETLNYNATQTLQQWSELYLLAQKIRGQ